MKDLKSPDYAYWPSRSVWFDVGYDLLTLANDCLADTPFGSPSEMFMSIDEPDFNCCDFISVNMQVIRPIQMREGAFPEENFQSVQNCDGIYWVPRYEITIGRPCKPLLAQDSNRPVPASEKERSEYARAIYHDTETISCCVTEKVSNGYELGGLTFSRQEVFPQQVYPETFGTCTRLRFRIMFDFDTCCIPHGKNGGRGYNDCDWVDRKLSEGPLGASPLPAMPSRYLLDEILEDQKARKNSHSKNEELK